MKKYKKQGATAWKYAVAPVYVRRQIFKKKDSQMETIAKVQEK